MMLVTTLRHRSSTIRLLPFRKEALLAPPPYVSGMADMKAPYMGKVFPNKPAGAAPRDPKVDEWATKAAAALKADGLLASGRSLYVELNLALQDPRGTSGVKAFHLNEHRRVRPQEIHYFDHPRLGALVRVTAVGKPEATQPAKRVKPAR